MDSLGLGTPSMVKLLQDRLANMGDRECATTGFDRTAVPVLTHAGSSTRQEGLADASTGAIVFDGGSASNLMTFNRAGIFAVCYCRLEDCVEASNEWILVARFTVRGPNNIHDWKFS